MAPRLYLWDNPNLTGLDGLDSLVSVGELELSSNGGLQDIDALAHLREPGRKINILYSSNLTNVDGLIGLDHGSFYFYSNGSLQNLDGLANVRSAGSISVEYNFELSDISGLRNLREAEVIRLQHLKGYTTLDGVFPVLERGALGVSETVGLVAIGTLPSLRSGEVGASGPDLETLGVFPVFEEGSVSGSGPRFTRIGDFPVLRNIEYLWLDEAREFSDLSGLTAVETVDVVWIKGTKITDLNELAAVTTYQDFALLGNSQLTDISALSATATVTGLARVLENLRLCQVQVDEIFSDIAVGELWSWDNGIVGCDAMAP